MTENNTKMTFLQRILKVKKEASENLSKEGKMNMGGREIKYYAVEDVVGVTRNACIEYNVLTSIVYKNHAEEKHMMASLEIIDAQNPQDKILFGEIAFLRTDDYQKTGSMLSYAKKYLFMQFFDLQDAQDVDDDTRKKAEDPKKEVDKIAINILTSDHLVIEKLQKAHFTLKTHWKDKSIQTYNKWYLASEKQVLERLKDFLKENSYDYDENLGYYKPLK